ncbi:19874_t:CDS:2, partial [Gigaspora rosea]
CKAVQLAEGLNVVNFNASEGWLSNFKKCYHISKYKRQSEATSAFIKDLPRFHNKLYTDDVYNADEIALYWHIKPDKTLAKYSEFPEPLNIRNAIDFTTTAWKKSNLANEPDLTNIIQNLIRQLPLDQPINAHEYITANNNLITTEIPTDEKIIEAIRNQDCIEPEDETPKKLISFVQALGIINGILSFLEQQPDGSFKVKNSLIRGLGKLKNEVNLKNISSKKQATLDTFIYSKD